MCQDLKMTMEATAKMSYGSRNIREEGVTALLAANMAECFTEYCNLNNHKEINQRVRIMHQFVVNSEQIENTAKKTNKRRRFDDKSSSSFSIARINSELQTFKLCSYQNGRLFSWHGLVLSLELFETRLELWRCSFGLRFLWIYKDLNERINRYDPTSVDVLQLLFRFMLSCH